MENGDIINDIEKISSETEQLAVTINNEMTSGTRALQNSKRSVTLSKILCLLSNLNLKQMLEKQT